MNNIKITTYSDKYRQQTIDLVLDIQRNEFGVPATLEEQPDLNDIPAFCKQWKGEFWLALNNNDEVIGTIAILDIDNQQGALRKMFVRADHRGKQFGVGLALLDGLFGWAAQKGMKEVFLGTTEMFVAAHKFYEKNKFDEIAKSELPATFPAMSLDVKFYRRMVK